MNTKRPNMHSLRIFLFLALLFSFLPATYGQSRITPSDVLAQVTQINKEIAIIKRHYKISKKVVVKPFVAKLTPRHSWQKSYLVMLKLNVIRQKNGLSRFPIGSMEPLPDIAPELLYAQSQRILTELTLLKTRLGILKKVSKAPKYFNKKPIDVFNGLHEASLNLELISHESIDPTYVFAEVLRVYEDLSQIVISKGIRDDSYPPSKVLSVTPKDSLKATFDLMAHIQKLQKKAGIKTIDFSPFKKGKEVHPSDVLNMVGMCLAEIQTVKAHMEIKHLTPAAEYHESKTPSDVHQLLRWASLKIQKITI
ncbi:MAG: hypothetical protein QNL04_10075 [SAR324 cluster bacterium]|nr:hypothetical protein [SAR324 cluster bacterium]